MRRQIYCLTVFLVIPAFALFLNCGGGGGGDSDPEPGCCAESYTLSGQAAVSDADANLTVPPQLRAATKSIKPKFATTARAALPSATVTLFQINGDGTESQVDIGTVTTDDSGNYTIDEVPVASSGAGTSDDFYYEVRVTSGDLTVTAPTAPTTDTTVNVSPETHLAALMLTDVQDVEGEALPRPGAIEDLRELTLDEVGTDLADSVELPSLTAGDMQVVAATAIASNGGNAEKGLTTFEAEKEFLLLDVADTEAAVDDVGAYLETIGKEACNFNEEFNLPETARDALADAFINDETVTPEALVATYNDNNGNDPDATTADAVADFDEILDNVDTAISDGSPIASGDQLGLFFKRDLTDDLFDSSTELQIDQAMAFTQQLLPTPCEAGAFDVVSFVSDLTGSATVSAPSIVDKQIYNDNMVSCLGGTGHLVVEIQVYATGGVTVNGVTLTDDGTKSLTRESTNGPFSRWRRNVQQGDNDFSTSFDCVPLPSDPEYTIAVDLEGASDISEMVTAHHRLVPEASISFLDADGNETPLENNQVTPTDSRRPIFKWSPAPGTPDSSVITDSPEGSELKFTFELSHVIPQATLNSWFGSGNVNEGPLSNCTIGGSDQRLMDQNYFIADSDCDLVACLAILQSSPTITFPNNSNQQVTKNTSEIQESDIVCRTNIGTFLVDENDRQLGSAAGNSRYYCYDSNDDGDCGN